MPVSAVFNHLTTGTKSERAPIKASPLVGQVIRPAIKIFSSERASGEKGPSTCRLSHSEKQEMIKKHSQLQEGEEVELDTLSGKERTILGQIHANSVAGDACEKCSLRTGVEALEELLQNAKAGQIPETLTRALAQLKQNADEMHEFKAKLPISFREKKKKRKLIYEYACGITQEVYKLSIGSSYFIEGVIEKDDTKVIYEFTRTSPTTFDLYVYNAGRKDVAFREECFDGRKTHMRPVIHFQNIPESELFFEEGVENIKADFFHALIICCINLPQKVGSSSLYNFLLGHLQQYRVKSTKDDPFMTLSHSKREVWDALRAILIRYLGKEAYKKVIFDCKFRSLVQAFKKISLDEDSQNAEEARNILKAGAKGILRSLAFQANPSKQAYATALDILDRIEKAEKEIALRPKSESEFGLLGFNQKTTKNRHQNTIECAKKAIKDIPAKPKTVETQRVQFVDLQVDQPVDEQLVALADNYLNKKEYKYIHALEIENFVNFLPIPTLQGDASILSAIPKEQLQTVIDVLRTLMYVYQAGMKEKKRAVTPKETNTAFALYLCVHFLSLRYEKEMLHKEETDPTSLAFYPLFFPGVELDQDPYLLFSSLEEYERRQEIIEYFKSTYASAQVTKEGDALFKLNRHECRAEGTNRGLAAYFMNLVTLHEPEEKEPNDKLRMAGKLYLELSEEQPIKYLTRYDCQHLPALAYAAYAAHLFSNGQKSRVSPSSNVFGVHVHLSKKAKSLSVHFDFTDKEVADEHSHTSANLHPLLGKNYQSLLMEHPWSERVRSEDTTLHEGEVLKREWENIQGEVDRKAFLRFSCEQGLFPHKLIAYYSSQIHLLTSSEEQTLFELAFFRPIINLPEESLANQREALLKSFLSGSGGSEYDQKKFQEGKRCFPLAEELLQPEFLKNVTRFIQAGIDRFYTRQPNARPNVFAVLFFFRLALRTSKFTNEPLGIDVIESLRSILSEKKGNPFNQDKALVVSLIKNFIQESGDDSDRDTIFQLNNMLSATNGLSLEEKSAVFLHLILGYAAQKDRLSREQLEELYSAWVFYKNTPLPKEWQNPLLEQEAEDFIYKQSRYLTKCSAGFRYRVLHSIFEHMDLGGLPYTALLDVPAKNKMHLVSATRGTQCWQVNLLTGKICNEVGIFKREDVPSWFKKEPFQTVLGKGEYSFLCASNVYYCTHPKLGMVRMYFGKANDEKIAVIERKIDEQWYQYVLLQKPSFPKCFIKGHTHWISTSEGSEKLIVAHLESGKRVATLEDNILTLADGITRVWNVKESAIPIAFARSESIYLGECERDTSLTLPNHFSQSNQPLVFTRDENDQFVYMQNPKYFLGNQKKGVFGDSKDLLLLTHVEDGSHKILIPLKKFDRINPLYTTQKSNEFFGEREILFFEYDVKEGEIIPLTQEGTVYLAYRYLAQNKYAKAIQLLRQIDFREPLSDTSWHILMQISRYAGSSQVSDSSPEATAVSLHAWVLMKKNNERMLQNGGEEHSLPKVEKLHENYMRHAHMIPKDLRIQYEEKKFVKKRKPDSISYPHIQDYVIKPNRPISLPTIRLQYPECGLELKPKLEDQKTRINRNREKVLKLTHFLDADKSNLNFKDFDSQLSRCLEVWSKDFEKAFFTQAYQVARFGTEEERKQLAFRMHLAYFSQDSRLLPQSWTFLQFALQHPNEAPPIPKDLTDVPARWEFVEALCVGIKQHNESKEEVNAKQQEPLQELPTFQSNPAEPYLPKKVTQEVESPLQLEPFSKESVDNGSTAQLFADYFKKRDLDSQQTSNVELIHSLEPEFPKKGERAGYQNALDEEFKLFIEDLKAGATVNDERSFYDLEDVWGLDVSLGDKIESFDAELKDLKVCILELANKQDPNSKQFKILEDAGVEKEITFNQLVDLFLQGDKEQFAKANPYLRNKGLISQLAKRYSFKEHGSDFVIDYLYNLIGLYMTIHVHRTQLQRAKKLSGKILQLGEEGFKKDALVQKLAQELVPLEEPVYSIRENPLFLVFEFLSGLTLRKKQADLLEGLLKRDVYETLTNQVIQLMMGEGKTSVLAVILLKEAAKKGRLSLFVTPTSQYATVRHNLRRALRTYFDQEMEEIEVSRDQLTPQMCHIIEKRLEESIAKGGFLLVKAETLQGLQLEFLDLVNQAYESDTISDKLLDQINTLRRILITFQSKGDALLDEVDLLLNVLQEVNFPIGEAKHVAAERIEVIREMFLLFSSEKIEIRDGEYINLEELIGLRANSQNLMGRETLYGPVAEALAFNLARRLPSLCLSHRQDLHASFRRYIDGTMSIKSQRFYLKPNQDLEKELTAEEKMDTEFLRYIHQLRKSQNLADQEAAHQIVLVKHMMQKVLPVTFSKIGKRHYGRGGNKPGEIRPFEAVDTPSKNLFGYHWEAVAYHFQTALQCGISKDQLLEIALVYKQQAEVQSEKESVRFNKTLEAVEFKALVGVKLHEIDEPECLDMAISKLNDNLEALLKIEADTASEFVTYYPYRLTATGQSLVSSLATVRAMSGTPWNVPCYAESLAENFHPDIGTEGQIADQVLRRIASKKEDKNYIHVARSTTIEAILSSFLDHHPEVDRVQMLMDSGALFKDFTNLQIAKAIRDKLQKPVLFFMRDPLKGEKTPDTLAVLKMNSDDPVIIGGTRLEDIEKAGLEVEDYFVFADDRHTTGTDIPLIPDAIGVMTIDETMLRRSFFQTILRLRDFFLHQDVEFLIPAYLLPILDKEIEQEMYNQNLNLILSVLLMNIKNQAAAKAKHYFRSCKQKIDHVFRKKMLSQKGLLCEGDLTHDDIKAKFAPYVQTTLINQYDTPFDQYWCLEDDVDSYDSLEAYYQRRLKLFPKEHPDYKSIEKGAKAILDKAYDSPYRPKTVREMGTEDLGSQVEVNVEIAAEVDQQVEQDIDVDLVKELNVYQRETYQFLRSEDRWETEKLETFLKELQKDDAQDQAEIFPLQNLLSSDHYQYKRDYSHVLSQSIQVTTSWAFTTDKSLPVFHQLQRPLDQILIIQTKKGEFKAIALSQNEAKQFKKFLNQNYASNDFEKVWLISPEGNLYEENPHGSLPNPKEIPELQKILVECHVFNGRVDLLDSAIETSMEWLYGNEDYLQQKRDFIQLRIANVPHQRKLFFISDVFGDPVVKDNKRKLRSRRIAEKLNLHGEAEIQSLKEDTKGVIMMLAGEQLNMLSPEQIPLIAAHQIAGLEKPELVRAIPEKFASRITNAQMQNIGAHQVQWFKDDIVKTQLIPVEFIDHMTKEQLNMLSPNQVKCLTEKRHVQQLKDELLQYITGEQVPLVSEAQIKHLRQPDAIAKVPAHFLAHVAEDLRREHLCEDQVSQLAPDAVELIQSLTEEQVKWLNSDDQFRSLTDEQFKWLSPRQINMIRSEDLVKKLSPEQIQHVHPDAANFIAHDKLQHLDKILQIRALTFDKYEFLIEAQVALLEDDDFEILQALNIEWRQKYFRVTHVKQLDPAQHQQQIQELTEEQVKWLVNEGQLRALEENQFAWLSPVQIETIIRSKDLIERLSNDQIAFVCTDVVEHVADDRLRYLNTLEQVRALKNEDKKRYEHLAAKQGILLRDANAQEDLEIIVGLTKELRETYLNEIHVKNLSHVDHQQQIKDLTEVQIKWLVSEDQLHVLEKGQFGSLSPAQIETIVRSKDLVDCLSNEQITHIHPDAVQHIEDGQIQYLSKILQVRALIPERYPHIADGQAKLLEDEDFEIMLALKTELRQNYMREAHVKQLDPREHLKHIQELTEAQVKHLKSEEQLKVLADEQIPWISADQVRDLVRSEEMFNRLAPEQMAYVDPQFVHLVPNTSIQYFKRLDQVKALTSERYEHLTAVQAALLEDEDFEMMLALNKNLRQKSMREAHVKRLDPHQHLTHIQELTNVQVKHLESEEQIQVLKTEQVDWLSDTQVRDLVGSKAMVERLAPKQLKRLNTDVQKRRYSDKSKQIALLVTGIIAALVAVAALVVGAFAVMGTHASFAPQFMVSIYKGLGSSNIAAYALTAGGGVILLGLVPYAIYRCCTRRTGRRGPILPETVL